MNLWLIFFNEFVLISDSRRDNSLCWSWYLQWSFWHRQVSYLEVLLPPFCMETNPRLPSNHVLLPSHGVQYHHSQHYPHLKESKIPIDEHVASGITGGVILLSCAVALVLSRLLPRKVLLLTSSMGACVNLALLGMYYYLRKTGPMNGLAWVPLVCMMAFITFFMVGFGAIAWTVTAELLPSSARGKIYPFIVAFSWICNFCFGYSFTHIQDWLGSFAAFWAFSGLSLVGAVFITLLVPETKERSSEDIADFFYTEPSPPSSNVTSVIDITCIT